MVLYRRFQHYAWCSWTRGINLPFRISCVDFKTWSDTCGLTHLPTRRAEFTWSNSRRGHAFTEKRLDRVICEDAWLDYWNSSTCSTLTRSKLDHFPILLSLQKETVQYKSYFKFLKIWIDHQDCFNVIADSWELEVVGCPIFILSQKLRNLNQF